MANNKPTKPTPGGSGSPNNQDPNNRFRQIFNRSWVWIILVIVLFLGYRMLFNPSSTTGNMVGLNDVAERVISGDVDRLVVRGEDVIVELTGGRPPLQTRKEPSESVLETLRALGVPEERLNALPIDVESIPNTGAFFNWLVMLLPMVLIFGFFIFIMRQAGGGGQNRAMQFGRSRAKKMDRGRPPHRHF